MPYLVVGEESTLLCVLSSFSSAARGTVDLEHRRIGQGKRPSIGGHTDDQLLLGGTQTDPHVGGVLHAELLTPLGVRAGRAEGGVVADLAFPLAVEVVCHQVDEVQVAESKEEQEER